MLPKGVDRLEGAAGRRAVTILAAGVLSMALIGIALPFFEARAQAQETVEVWVLGVEYKGTAGADEPYIAEGDKVEAYVFYPDTIRVVKGQTVVLHFLGINGGSGHPMTIERYVEEPFTFYRNQTLTKEFVADQAGVFQIACLKHQPTMNAQLIVEEPVGVWPTWSLVILAAQATLFVATLFLVLRKPRPRSP